MGSIIGVFNGVYFNDLLWILVLFISLYTYVIILLINSVHNNRRKSRRSLSKTRFDLVIDNNRVKVNLNRVYKYKGIVCFNFR